MNQENPTLIGQILVAMDKITEEQLEKALEMQKSMSQETKKPLGQILLELDFIDANDIIEAIRVQVQMRRGEKNILNTSAVSAN